jgi:plastocyanin
MITTDAVACQTWREVVVMKTWLAVLISITLAAPALAADPKEHKVEILDLKYTPAKLTVKKGDKIVWVNADDRDHTVVARPPKDGKNTKEKPAFNSGKIASGDRFEFRFEKAGKYEYGCEYHPRMKGMIEVTD